MNAAMSPALDRLPLSEPPPVPKRRPIAHGVERLVRESLTADPTLKFSDLVVHRVDDGVCLTGMVESSGHGDPENEIDHLVRQVAGVHAVINRLIIRPAAE